MDVSDGPAYLLLIPDTTNVEIDRCIHRLLEDLRQLQGTGIRDELDFLVRAYPTDFTRQ